MTPRWQRMARNWGIAPLLWPLISGLALGLSFPDFSLYPLAWVALVPMLHFLLRVPAWRSVLAGHFLMAFFYFGVLLYWIPRVLVEYGDLGRPVALGVFLLLLFVLGLALAPFSLLTRWVAGRSPERALWAAPGFWVLTELFRNYLLINGFPWGLLGYTQFPFTWLVQVADVSGVYLISFLVVAVNSALLALFRFRAWGLFALVASALALALLYGGYRLHLWAPAEGPARTVALVQPGIALSADREYYARQYFEVLPAYYREAVDRGADWVVFPEAQNPFFYHQDFYYRTFWRREVIKGSAFLLFNSTFQEESPPGRYFNTAWLLDRQGKTVHRYDKVRLVPFGEYVPFERWLGFAEALVAEVSAFSAGSSLEPAELNGTRFGTLICYEGIFPELSRRYAGRGAQLLVNITNDLWFGDTAAPRQHLQIAAFRAVETRKPLLRAANSGISAAIDPWGRVLERLDLFQEGTILTPVRGNAYRPIYCYTGEWLNIVLVLAGFLAPWRVARQRGRGGTSSQGK